jgi:O-antigen/teichoic acid export membrane protein
MIEIKRLLKHSAVYFVGNALNRLGIFLLLPVYTHYLAPEEYGILELVFVTVALLRLFLGMRLGHATLRFYFEYKEENDRNKLISTSLISVTAWCLLLTLTLIGLSSQISEFIYGTNDYSLILTLGFLVMFFEVINEIPFAYFRAKEYSLLFVISSLSQLLLRVAINVYVVIFMHKGVAGILTGNLISASLLWIFLCFFVFKSTGISFDFAKLKDLFKYSYPLIIASVPGLVSRNFDRVMLGWHASLEMVGIYALAVRFGMALRAFVLEPFQMNYGPFRFSIMNQDNAKEVYSRVFVYFLFLVVFIGLFMALLCREVIEIMSSEAFISAYKVVPLILLAVLANGVNYIFQTGLLIKKRTDYMPYITIITAVMNVLTLFMLVPQMGIYGAALARAVTSFIEIALTLHLSQKCYKIKFDIQRAVKIAAVAVFISVLALFTNEMGIYERIGIKTFLVLTFPFLLMTLRFYRQDEIEKIFIFKEKIRIEALSAFGFIRR